jgi:septal ring-binding cell division protein DamX
VGVQHVGGGTIGGILTSETVVGADAGAVTAAVGAGEIAGGVRNLAAIATTPMRMSSSSKDGTYAPNRELPRDPKTGKPVPESENPHTQLGTRNSRTRPGEKYTQGREFGKGGKHVRDVDFTTHGRKDHTNPHQHRIDPKTGKRGMQEPL